MAMSKCKECGKSISTLAKTCPGCGAPNPTKKTSSKEKKSKTKTPIQIIAIVVMLGLLSIPVFNWGNFGLNKVKKINNETKSKNKLVKIKQTFTCEGRATSKSAGIDDNFIDEYTLIYKNDHWQLNNESSLPLGRPYSIFEENAGNLKISKRAIKMKVDYFIENNAEGMDVKLGPYRGTISLDSGNYSANMIYEFKADNTKHSASFTGKCIGLESVKKLIQ